MPVLWVLGSPYGAGASGAWQSLWRWSLRRLAVPMALGLGWEAVTVFFIYLFFSFFLLRSNDEYVIFFFFFLSFFPSSFLMLFPPFGVRSAPKSLEPQGFRDR
jgi:hypothetical protein